MKIKQNKYIIAVFLIMIAIIGYSFYQYYDEHFGYTKSYYIIKENCYEKKNVNHEYCKRFLLEKTDKLINEYIENSDPVKNIKKLDTITLTCEIVENTLFSTMQLISPLLVLLAFIGTIHSEFSSGMVKNYLLREEYKSYFKNLYKVIAKVSFILPLSLVLIFVVSMLLTKFNFNLANVDPNLAESWKYNNFIVYGLIVCIIQFFMSVFYCNIGLYCCTKNKNKLVSIFMGYVLFLILNILIYVGLYCYIIKNFIGLTANLTEYFNITGYWFFDFGLSSCLIVVLISIFLSIVSSLVIYYFYKNKERFIIDCEIQNT